MPDEFLQEFARVDESHKLPAVYRRFILTGAYRPYQECFVRGLYGYGQSDVALSLSSKRLLDRDRLFDHADIEPDEGAAYHPVALVEGSSQFLAIDTSAEEAPVFLWHHETGAFHRQFDSFNQFVASLRTLADVESERAETRRWIRAVRQQCQPGLERAQHLFNHGDTDGAAAALDAALVGLYPVEYDGTNDFDAISILASAFVLRGRAFLAREQITAARDAFLDAARCGGRPYSEALVDAAITSSLVHDLGPMLARTGVLETGDVDEATLTAVLLRDFDGRRLERARAFLTAPGGTADERRMAATILNWLDRA